MKLTIFFVTQSYVHGNFTRLVITLEAKKKNRKNDCDKN